MRAPAPEVEALARELRDAWQARGATPLERGRAPRVVDLGAGEGRHVAALGDEGLDVVALDRDVASARAIVDLAPGTEFALHDFGRGPLPFAPDAFDAAVLWSVLPHVSAEIVPPLLRETGRVLAKGGVLLLNFVDRRDGRRDPATGARLAALAAGPDLFLSREDVDPHLWWGKIADARLVREEVRGHPDLDRTAEWRLRVVKQ